jgi:hypothetical protein
MMSKLLPIGLMVVAVGFSVQTANAQWSYGSGCSSGAPTGPPPAGWNGPSSYQPGPNQAAPAPPPPPAPQSTQFNGQSNGQMAQSNNQTYQSFSAEPAPVYSSPPAATYSYPAYGGYGGFYGSPYNNGYYGYGNNQSWRRWDNAGNHGFPNY